MIHLTPMEVATFAATFVRTAAWIQTAPIVGDQTTPRRVRGGAAVLIAMALLPGRPPVSPETIWFVLPGELLIGICIGMVARILMAGIEAGGQIIGVEMGLNFGGQFDPVLRDEANPVHRIFHIVGSLVFLSAGGINSSVRALSAATVSGRTLRIAASGMVESSSQVLELALRASAPMLVAATITRLAAGMASRAAPAFNVFSVMLSMMAVLGGLVLLATGPAFFREVSLAVHRSMGAMTQMATP